MLSSINFLFLLALAFISWFILCYLETFKDQMRQDLNITNISTDYGMASPSQSSYRNKFDLVYNFAFIFIYLYSVCKVAQVLETYIIGRSQRAYQAAQSNQASAVMDRKLLIEMLRLHIIQRKVMFQLSEFQSQMNDLQSSLKEIEERISNMGTTNKNTSRDPSNNTEIYTFYDNSSEIDIEICDLEDDHERDEVQPTEKDMEPLVNLVNNNNCVSDVKNSIYNMSQESSMYEKPITDKKYLGTKDVGNKDECNGNWQKYLEMQKLFIQVPNNNSVLPENFEETASNIMSDQMSKSSFYNKYE